MERPLPATALLLGIAGLLPFIGCGLLAVRPDGDRGAMALLAYGAVVLSFLGGVHWGFALPDPSGHGSRARLGLGVVPSLVGWIGLLIAVAVNVESALGVLILGFAGTIIMESRAAASGLMPRGYLLLRYALSTVVIAVLVIVVALRLVGAHIVIW